MADLERLPPGADLTPLQREALFADLVVPCLPELRAYARRLAGDAHMADDCVQDACIRALAAFAHFDTARPFRPWIFRILRNEWLQRLRRERRMTSMPSEILNDMLVDHRLPENTVDGATLLALIADLPAGMSDAIRLVLVLGLSYEEAAALCDCAPGTMKSRVNRARAVLVDRLEGRDPKAGRRAA